MRLPGRLEGLREHCEVPQGGRGQSPAKNELGAFPGRQRATGSNVLG